MNSIKNISTISITDEEGERIFNSNKVITNILLPIEVADKPALCYDYYDFDQWCCQNCNKCKFCCFRFCILNCFICCF